MLFCLETIGYILTLVIGLSLGLVGGGGSILTVPVLVYLFGISPLPATSYSLFIVGITSFVGCANSFGTKEKEIDWRTVILFGLPSMITVLLVRQILLPLMPSRISFGDYKMAFETLIMILFAGVMILSSFFMIGGKRKLEEQPTRTWFINTAIVYGVIVGLVSGVLGAGGGFLLIPALVVLLHMEMKKAIATSLLIIALNSLVGFAGDLGHYTTDWTLVSILSLIAVTGVIAGRWLNKKTGNERLRRGFGYFIFLLGLLILTREIVVSFL